MEHFGISKDTFAFQEATQEQRIAIVHLPDVGDYIYEPYTENGGYAVVRTFEKDNSRVANTYYMGKVTFYEFKAQLEGYRERSKKGPSTPQEHQDNHFRIKILTTTHVLFLERKAGNEEWSVRVLYHEWPNRTQAEEFNATEAGAIRYVTDFIGLSGYGQLLLVRFGLVSDAPIHYVYQAGKIVEVDSGVTISEGKLLANIALAICGAIE